MLFNSYEFIFAFLPVVLAGFFFIAARIGHEWAIAWLVLASLFFYGWWNPIYLSSIIVSILFNFGIGRILSYYQQQANKAGEKTFLIVGIAFNLGLLGYFKYANFFIDNVNHLLNTGFHLDTIILPLGISFFTFTQIAYLVDVYRDEAREYNFLHYCLFVTYFPHLIAGPVLHHKEIIPQFYQKIIYRINGEYIIIGLTVFAIGLFKKAVLADGVAPYANSVFNSATHGEALTFFVAWGGALAYTMQLYFDFSGYCDMAIGASYLFGIKLPLNFHSPYKAINIAEFWRRWHMTLSRFLRNYVYIPLGGNRKGHSRRYGNLITTMLLGGLWHGAGWNFIIWGGLHGCYLAINHGWRHWRQTLGFDGNRFTVFRRGMAWLVTFLAVVVGWVFFRAATLEAATKMLQGMIGFHGVAIPNGIAVHLGVLQDYLRQMGVDFYLGGGNNFILTYAWVFSLMFIALVLPNTQQIMAHFPAAFSPYRLDSNDSIRVGNRLSAYFAWTPARIWAIIVGVIVTIGVLTLSSVSEFLYFQF